MCPASAARDKEPDQRSEQSSTTTVPVTASANPRRAAEAPAAWNDRASGDRPRRPRSARVVVDRATASSMWTRQARASDSVPPGGGGVKVRHVLTVRPERAE